MRRSFAGLLTVGVLATSASAADLDYTYLEAGFGKYDADESGTVANPKKDLIGEVTTDDESGFYLGGSWQFTGRWLVFAHYSEANQDATLKGTGDDGIGGTADVNQDGDFDLNRLRAGVGYVRPMSERWDLYGRLSVDYIQMDSVGFASTPARQAIPPDPDAEPPVEGRPAVPGVPGVPGNDEDDVGFGAQIGARMALWRQLDGEAWVRYSSVGDLSIERDYSGDFDDDLLGGIELHWLIGNRFGVEATYEYGEITTWSVGARFHL
jgi:hypothetical protein